jgi:hypothetical protein
MGVKRTIGLARTHDLNKPWKIDPEPILPPDEQIENTSFYFEPMSGIWFMFTNHVGIAPRSPGSNDFWEFTDAIWVYWTRDLLHWNPADKAVVLDASNCSWSLRIIGLPSVVAHGNRLHLYYDGLSGDGGPFSHLNRDVGLAFIDLPLTVPN